MRDAEMPRQELYCDMAVLPRLYCDMAVFHNGCVIKGAGP
jgi:hypothetical protein